MKQKGYVNFMNRLCNSKEKVMWNKFHIIGIKSTYLYLDF